MFKILVLRTLHWEAPEWEEVEGQFNTEEDAELFGEYWLSKQPIVELSDGLHIVGIFKVIQNGKEVK